MRRVAAAAAAGGAEGGRGRRHRPPAPPPPPPPAHYVFALGVSRFISCSHWLLQLADGSSFLLRALGSGLWPAAVLASEVVQTFILADFCYYYVKSYADGSGVIHLAAGIV